MTELAILLTLVQVGLVLRWLVLAHVAIRNNRRNWGA